MTKVKKTLSPLWVNLSLLLLAIVLNVAVGAVFIPPGTLLKIFAFS